MSNKSQFDLTLEQQKQALLNHHYASIRKMNTKHLNKALTSSPSVLSRFDSKQVANFLQNPQKHEKQLRQLSNYLYNVNAQYRQIVRHFATLPTYDYTLNIVEMPTKINADKITKAYQKAAQYVDKLNLKDEMSEVLKVAFKEDVFYGYEHESKDSYFIQKLDADYCQISSIEDGVFNFAYDFSYFDKFKDSIELFPDEFKVKYQIYNLNKQTNRWLELDSDKTICIKINSDITDYALPPFNTVFESIFDQDEYKKIKKAKAKMDNFLLLTQLIPMDDKSQDVDVFKISLDLAMQFHNQLSESLGEGIGLATTPMEIEAIKLEKSKSDNDSVSEAIRETYTDAGLSQYLFNSDKNTSAGITKSIITDEQFLFSILTQIERWVNRKLKKQSGTIKFYIRFLQLTNFSREEVFNRYLKAAQFGAPVKMEMVASLGLSPLEILNKTTLENEIFKLHDLFIPLQSSHTQTDSNKAGAPKKNENDISESRQVDLDNLDD
ncbi:hypothetical protein [Bacillus sp. FJAT-22090]|uniref:hypothetical protein n=1 Tax=Bacillus sp. FJAT-22090 TaxID=1581038 RepID=UPI0011A2991B|nr:hypothetical protein [Bacillus sp. FJAT-22090]